MGRPYIVYVKRSVKVTR